MKKLNQLLKANAAETRAPISASVTGAEATIYLYDVIDQYYGINAADFVRAISGLEADVVNLRINSPGGDVFEARAIASAIKGFDGKVVAHIDGLAASAATTIAAVCDEVIIADGSFYMIHNAWTMALGDKSSLRETADLLDKVDVAICADYAKRTGMKCEEIAAYMDAETWFSAQEAVDLKFADSLAPEPKARNSAVKKWNLEAYDNAPKVSDEAPEADDFAVVRARNERRLRLLSID